MLNPNIEIKKWFYTNLTGSSGLPVYDGYAPNDGVNEYIIMNGRTSSQDQGKISYTNGVTIDVDIVIKNSNFGYKRAETISDLILAAINSQTAITLTNGFYASSLVVGAIRNLDALEPSDNIFRTIITYNLIITQN
jgi:hypothetical protein